MFLIKTQIMEIFRHAGSGVKLATLGQTCVISLSHNN